MKTRNRPSGSCVVMENMFTGEMEDKILNIGYSIALSRMTSEKDKIFYKSWQTDLSESSVGSPNRKMTQTGHRK